MKRLPPSKIPPPFALRPVAPPDAAFLLRLYGSIRADELARSTWDDARRDEFLRGQFRARAADHGARFPGAEHSVIEVAGREAGMWMVWRGPAEIRLVNIELLPEHRGRGLGTALLRSLITESENTRLPLALSVRDDNVAAARLYRRLGFVLETREGCYLKMRRKPLR